MLDEPYDEFEDEDSVVEVTNTNKDEEIRLQRRMRQRKVTEALERAQMLTEVLGEQPFKAGVDPGLKIWIYVREQLRAVNSGELLLPETYPTRIKYKYRTYWMEETHKEWSLMIAEAIAEKEDAIRNEHKKMADAERLKDTAEASERNRKHLLDTETEDEKVQRIAAEKAEKEHMEIELKLMRAVDRESSEEEKAYRLWVEEGLEIARDRRKKMPGVLLHDDGTIREDRGVYGMLPLLDPKMPRRCPGLTLTQFQHYAMYSNDRPGTLLLAFNHHHWKYFELILGVAGAGAKQLINLPIYEKTGRTLLHLAVLQGDPERVQYLLDRGADPIIADLKGNTPLHLSMDHDVFIHYHDVNIAADLLRSRHANAAKGSKHSEKLVNLANLRGVTPLHRAVLLGALDYVKLFLKSKAKVFVFDNCKKLPIQYAKEEWEPEVRELFNDNVRFCGKRMHMEMWAYIMSRKFVHGIFEIVAPVCSICHRKQYDCASLKKKDRRYWIYAHELGGRKK